MSFEFSGPIIEVTKEFILDRVSEEAIFQRYLGIRVQTREQFCSPLRQDDNPTCVFSYHDGRVKYRDWAEPISKDCFDIVMEKFGLSYHEALQKVAKDFGVVNLDVDPSIEEHRKEIRAKEEKFKTKSFIQVKFQQFTPTDIEYLKQFGITHAICKQFRCFSLKYVWVNGKLYHTYLPNDPMLGYYFGTGEGGAERWKIYFYRRGRTSPRPRFLGNTNRINGWVQIPKTADHLVLTKSMKDVMTLARFGIHAIAMQNETTLIYDYLVDELKERFGKLFSLYDFDPTGVRMSNRLRKEYGIIPLFLTNGRFGTRDMGSKDISDFVRDHGIDRTQKVVDYARSRYGIVSP